MILAGVDFMTAIHFVHDLKFFSSYREYSWQSNLIGSKLYSYNVESKHCNSASIIISMTDHC